MIYRLKKLCRFFKFGLVERYMAGGAIIPFVFTTLFFIFFLLIFQLFRIIQLVVNKGIEASVVAELVVYIAASFLPLSIPISLLFATIYTLGKLSEDSEIIAMRSFGFSKMRLLIPFLAVGVIVAMSLFSLNRNLIPYSRRVFKNTIVYLTSKGVLANIKKGQFYTEIPNVMLFAEDVSDDGLHLKNIFIETKQENGNERVVMAKEGHLQKITDSLSSTPTLRMHLSEGNLIKFTELGEVEKIHFKEYDFPVMNQFMPPEFVNRENTRTNKELLLKLKEDKDTYKRLLEKSQKATLARQEQKLLERSKLSINTAELEYWTRISGPLQCLVFVFLGVALGIKQKRGRSKNSGVLTLISLSFYYLAFFAGTAFVRKGVLPPWFVAFFPITLTFLVASYYYRKLDWIS